MCRSLGGLHLEEVPLVVPGVRSYLHRQQLTDAEEHVQTISRDTLRMLTEMLPLFKGASYPDGVTLAEYQEGLPSEDAELMNMRISRLKRRADSLWRKQSNISNDMTTLESYRHKLTLLNAIKESSNFSESMKYLALLVTEEDQGRLQALEKQLGEQTQDNFSVLQADSKKKHAEGDSVSDDVDVAVLAYPEEYDEVVRRSVRRSGLAEFRLPKQARGLPLMEAAETLKTHLEELPGILAKTNDQVAKFKAENYPAAIAIETICRANLARLEAKTKLAHSGLVCVIQGWVPSGQLPEMRSTLSGDIGAEVLITELPQDAKTMVQIPVHLKNAKAFKPFEQLVRLFSNPLYGSMDPTALIAVVFPIFFGLILGDAAYGLCIIGLALWARRKWRHLESAKDISGFIAAAISK